MEIQQGSRHVASAACSGPAWCQRGARHLHACWHTWERPCYGYISTSMTLSFSVMCARLRKAQPAPPAEVAGPYSNVNMSHARELVPREGRRQKQSPSSTFRKICLPRHRSREFCRGLEALAAALAGERPPTGAALWLASLQSLQVDFLVCTSTSLQRTVTIPQMSSLLRTKPSDLRCFLETPNVRHLDGFESHLETWREPGRAQTACR